MYRKAIIIGALLVAVAAARVGYAAIPSADGTISACKNSKGALKVIDAEAGQTCTDGQQLLTWNQQGPASAAGTIQSGHAAGVGHDPKAATQFLSPAVQLNVATGQKVHLVANKAFGTQASPAGLLDLYPCYQSTLLGSPIVTQGLGIINNKLPANSRVTMGISYVITGLSSGTYNFGMCGDDDGDGHWTSNDAGYVAVIKLDN
jgi:hypothetical protein